MYIFFKKTQKVFRAFFVFVLIFIWLFSGWPPVFNNPQIPSKVNEAQAAVADVGHWRDSTGSQIPGTAFAGMNFASQQRNDGSAYSKPNDSTIQVTDAGHYLFIASIRTNDASNGRFNPQARFSLTSGTGTLFTSYYTGYNRDTSEDDAWVRAVGVLVSGSANAQVQIQWRRDTDAPSGGSVINASDIQVARINPTNWGIYAFGATTGALGGITPNLVDLTASTLESDTLAIEGNATTDTVTVKGDNKRYLVAWSVSGDSGTTRTQRVGHLEYDGVDDLATRSYCYLRQSSDEYCGLGSMDIVNTATADIAIQVEVWRGNGILADEGGADNDGGWDVDGNGQMVVLELPDLAEVFRSHDATGLQDVTSAVTLNAMGTVDFNDAASFTQASASAMNVVKAADVFVWANVWTARNVVSSSTRLTAYGSITINGVEQTTGRHGAYTRGNNGSIDTFGGGFQPAGIYNVSTGGYDIGVNMTPLSGTEGGGTDRTQAGTVGFLAINLDTLISAPNTNQIHFRWRDDTTALNTTGGWLATEDNNTIGDIIKNSTYRIRLESANTGAAVESAARTYELQWGEKTGATCGTISTWTGLANASDAFDMVDSANISPDGQATTAGLLANTETYTRISGEGRDVADTTSSIGPISTNNYTELEYSFKATDDAVTGTNYCFRLYDTTAGTTLDGYSVYPEVTISSTTVSYNNTIMEWGTQASVGDDAWTTVNFSGNYIDPIFVCSSEYNANIGNESDTTADSVVCRVQNVGATSAQVRLQEPGTLVGSVGNLTAETINWIVVEAGEYNTADIKMEAFKYTSTVTDGKTPGWAGQAQTLVQSYTSPVVLGQVMTTNDTAHSQFWAHNGSKGAPTSSALYTGKHISEDTTTTRSDETVGVIVIEQANNTVNTVVYEARLQTQTIDRIDDAPPSTYTFNTAFSTTPSVAIISLAGVSGTDGPFPSLYGTTILSTTTIDLVVMETEIVDTEQTGNTEFVPYIVFESTGTYAVSASIALDQTTYRFYNNADSVQPSTAKAAENTALTSVATNDILRIRTAIQAGDLLEASALQFKLQYGQGATCSAIGTWTDVDVIAGAGIWRGYNNATPADGASITSSLLNSQTNALESYEEQNNSVSNPAVITQGNRGEWDWAIQNNGATSGTDYCFRMVLSDASVFQYTNYPKVTTVGVTFIQNYYRFYVDNDALDPTDPWPVGGTDLGENTTITASDEPPGSADKLRVRMSIQVGTSALGASSQAFKLQFGTQVTTCSAIGSWTDLGAPASGAIWRGFNGTPVDGTNLSIDPPTGGDLNLSVSDRAGTYEEQNNTATNPFTVAVGEDVEYDWAIEDNGATATTTYCFRMVKSDAVALDTYSFYPTVTTSDFRPKSQNWRWYDDETNETPLTALAAENVAPTNVVNDNIIKLRLTINETAGAAGTNIRFKIQFSEYSNFSAGVTDAVEIGSCTGNSLWCYGDGVDTDDGVITTLVLADSTVVGRHNESGTVASTFDPTASTATEYEFTLKHAGARVNTTYFFRAYDVPNATAVALNTSETYPSLSTEGATLNFTIGGLSSGTSTEGILTDVTTTSTTIPFGILSYGVETEAAQRITVSSNATGGYKLFTFQRQNLIRSGGPDINPITGTNTSPSAWATGCSVGVDGCYGYHAGDNALDGGSTRFSPNDTYAQFSSTLEEVAYSSFPVSNDINDMIYKTEVSNQQEAGDYSSSIVYIVVPVF